MTRKEAEIAIGNYYNGWAEKQIRRSLKMLRAELADLYEGGGGINYDGMPHSTTPGNPPLEMVSRMDGEPERLRADIAEQHRKLLGCIRKNREVQKAIERLSDVEQGLLYMHFVAPRKWETISQSTHYNAEYLRKKIYPRILDKAASLMEK